ncbi:MULTISPECIES: Uma2 family endonuclease [Actinomadura]|uniref:Uma2 family endonuclease n=1 Tax=Actinomadura litoris TaxID=2678616 RepID=A0A7K1LD33_9ACTN|nr:MULTISPECIES: Uma2 family endonuclease [Actinomadura]MBT2208393.1 Uma2 family endonuclease [Actinomadura sp. NEAU-AAG7]MUN42341.1 Uma2 family endonuclease [Actinomadura litoris]
MGATYGPYTLYDLDALPEEGRRYELADGWLHELPGDLWHDHAAQQLRGILKEAARQADADVHVAGAPQDVTTPAGIRKPDVFAVSRDVARAALERRTRTYYGPDLILVAEVVTPRTVNEQIDRVRKVEEYAATGIPHYWLIDLEPRPTVTMLDLADGGYRVAGRARAGETLALERPFTISFDPARLSEMD